MIQRKLQLLKTARNEALYSIRKINRNEKDKHILTLIEDINSSKNDSRRMFQALNVIRRHQVNQIFVNDKDGRPSWRHNISNC